MTVKELAEFKAGARATWATGDYSAIAERELWPIGAQLVQRIAVTTGEDVLDVACGSGNAALRAAQAGARVVALDLTPELFERGRELAAQAGVEVEWVEGDAEALPFEDESFDVVLSVFGSMFAPRHEVTARELARVLRPGGRVGVCSWTAEGSVGAFFSMIARHLPAPPEFAAPPVLWGSEDYVRALFEGTGLELGFERAVAPDGPEYESVDAAIDFYTTSFGPLVAARRHTEAEGSWPALRADLVDFALSEEPAEYLQVLGRKR